MGPCRIWWGQQFSEDQLKNVQQIQASKYAFAAILGGGSVVTWGREFYEGDSSSVQDQLKDVQQIQATPMAFVAILGDGSVVTWGDKHYGGDSRSVQDQLKIVLPHAESGEKMCRQSGQGKSCYMALEAHTISHSTSFPCPSQAFRARCRSSKLTHLVDWFGGSEDHTDIRILQTMVSGIPLCFGPLNQNPGSLCLPRLTTPHKHKDPLWKTVASTFIGMTSSACHQQKTGRSLGGHGHKLLITTSCRTT